MRRSPCWRLTALWPARGARHEPEPLTDQWSPVRVGHGVPGLAPRPLRRLPTPDVVTFNTARAARTGRRDAGCGVARGDPRRAGRQPVSWRGSSQGVGPAARGRHPHLAAARTGADARERIIGPDPSWI